MTFRRGRKEKGVKGKEKERRENRGRKRKDWGGKEREGEHRQGKGKAIGMEGRQEGRKERTKSNNTKHIQIYLLTIKSIPDDIATEPLVDHNNPR